MKSSKGILILIIFLINTVITFAQDDKSKKPVKKTDEKTSVESKRITSDDKHAEKAALKIAQTNKTQNSVGNAVSETNVIDNTQVKSIKKTEP